MEIDYEDYIRKHFTYKDGVLTRDDRKGSDGSLDKDGYLIVKIKGRQFKAHRIIWFLCRGKFPDGMIDHINRVRNDNRIENLRDVSPAENIKNTARKPNPDTGYIGVYLDKSTVGLKAKYSVSVGKRTYRFRALEDAVEFRERCINNGSLQSISNNSI